MGQIVGAGNFAKVYKSFNKKTLEWVVLKVVKKENVAAMKHVDHIINERNVLKYLTKLWEQAKLSEKKKYEDLICPFIV